MIHIQHITRAIRTVDGTIKYLLNRRGMSPQDSAAYVRQLGLIILDDVAQFNVHTALSLDLLSAINPALLITGNINVSIEGSRRQMRTFKHLAQRFEVVEVFAGAHA